MVRDAADRRLRWTLMALVLVSGAVVVGAQPAQAATVTPTKTTDSNDGVCDADCSLREAISAAAVAGDDVVPLGGLTYTLTLGELVIDGAGTLTLKGPGTIDQDTADHRVLRVTSGDTVIIDEVTVMGGDATDAGGGIQNSGTLTVVSSTISGNSASVSGGGVKNNSLLTLISSTVSGNTANFGGGISNDFNITITSSTVSGNTASGGGGAGIANNGGTLALTSSTVSGNTAAGGGGGIEVAGGTATIEASIVAANSAGVIGPDCHGAMGSNGFNVFGPGGGCPSTGTGDVAADPELGPLADNGGPTRTHAISATSPALDRHIAADPECAAAGTDQRGLPRPTGTACDSGAVERAAPTSFVPTKTDDTNDSVCSLVDCSLREALSAAAANVSDDTVALGGQTYSLTLDQLTVDGQGTLGLQGPGVIDQDFPGRRVLQVTLGDAVTIDRVTLTGGNSFTSGGGVFNVGILTLTRSTVSGNIAGGSGGGIANGFTDPPATLTITSSTVSGNSVGGGGGGIANFSGRVTIEGSIVAGNTSNDCGGAPMTSNGFNVLGPSGGCPSTGAGDVEADPLLGPLQDNGGSTLTHAFAGASPAIDRVPAAEASCAGAGTDQRGSTRRAGPGCDSGAYESLCGLVVTGVFQLQENLACPKRGLVVGAPNTVIDLNGHTITGPGPGTGVGVGSKPGADVSGSVVRDGTLRGFGFGVRLVDHDLIVSDIRARGGGFGVVVIGRTPTLRGLSVLGAHRNGIVVRSPDLARVTASESSANERGIVVRAPTAVVTGNTARNNQIRGIVADPAAGASGNNTATGNPVPQCVPSTLC